MVRALVSGGTGYVGRFIVDALLGRGHSVVVAGRNPPAAGIFAKPTDFRALSLTPAGPQDGFFEGVEVFIHAAFDHVPGHYRGGEGDDPEGFRARNLAGTTALFQAARAAGVGRVLFLSSRAVYGPKPAGDLLREIMPPEPDTLYGEVKLGAELSLAAQSGRGFTGTSLRITGVYGPAGPGRTHKWAGLFADYLAGKDIDARAGTEVHGGDVAAAVLTLMAAPAEAVSGEVFNVSDLVVDRRHILAPLKRRAGVEHPLPAPADTSALNVMDTSKLRGLGWRPGGRTLLERTLDELAAV